MLDSYEAGRGRIGHPDNINPVHRHFEKTLIDEFEDAWNKSFMGEELTNDEILRLYGIRQFDYNWKQAQCILRKRAIKKAALTA